MSYRTPSTYLLAVFAAAIAMFVDATAVAQIAASKTRHFQFNYGATIVELPSDSQVRVWVPIPVNNSHQTIELKSCSVQEQLQRQPDETYGNLIGYFPLQAEQNGKASFNFKYLVTRQEASADGATELSESQKAGFLKANRLVPVDGRPTEILNERLPDEPTAAAARLYDIVEQHMKYDKSKPGYGKGDSVWACDSRTGNCTDFHSLFISLARSKSLPARFEIGFPLPNDKNEGVIKGYHCWAWFFADGEGWTPVDISEADKHPEMKDYYFGKLTPDRVSFSTGRDIQLVPKSAAGPLNYFVYPHIEVNGKPWPREKIKLAFSFKDKMPSPTTDVN
jgi:transglutaminase-like putative cysteine protease